MKRMRFLQERENVEVFSDESYKKKHLSFPERRLKMPEGARFFDEVTIASVKL